MLATPAQAARIRRETEALAAIQRDTFLESVQSMSLSKMKHDQIAAEYILAPHDTIEPWRWSIIVTVPSLTAPTWLLPKGKRTVTRANVAALALPSLEWLTLGAAQVVSHEHSTMHRLYEMRRAGGSDLGSMRGDLVPLDWYA